MKLLLAAMLVAFPLAGFAQTIDGNGGSGGTATATVVLTPAGDIAGACTNVTSCVDFHRPARRGVEWWGASLARRGDAIRQNGLPQQPGVQRRVRVLISGRLA